MVLHLCSKRGSSSSSVRLTCASVCGGLAPGPDVNRKQVRGRPAERIATADALKNRVPKTRNLVFRCLLAGRKFEDDREPSVSALSFYCFMATAAGGRFARRASRDPFRRLQHPRSIIWAKQHFAMSRGNYPWEHEPCWYSVRKDRSAHWRGDRKQSTWRKGMRRWSSQPNRARSHSQRDAPDRR